MHQRSGCKQIIDERTKQIIELGFDYKHDREHNGDQLLRAAICYLIHAYHNSRITELTKSTFWEYWPMSWSKNKKWKPKTKMENLVTAGALIAAEIDRMNVVQNEHS